MSSILIGSTLLFNDFAPMPAPQDVVKPRQRTVKDRLQELLSIYELGLIEEEELAAKRKELLDSL